MEPKKSPKADLESKKTLFLEIGLCLSLVLMIVAFGISQNEKVVETLGEVEVPVEKETVEITIEEEYNPLPPQPQQAVSALSEVINVVKDDAKITEEMEFAEFDDETAFVKTITPGGHGPRNEDIDETNIPVLKLQNMPKFQGKDMNHFKNWVLLNIEYPEDARANQIQGTVYMKFVIDNKGNLVNIEEVLSPHPSLTNEVIKVLKKSPVWTPGNQRGVNQALLVNMDFTFMPE